MKKQILPLLAALSLSALAIPCAAATKKAPPVPLLEAQAWEAQQEGYSKSGDIRALKGLRDSTVIHIQMTADSGKPMSLELAGPRLTAYYEQNLAKAKATADLADTARTCAWASDARTGFALQTCRVIAKLKKAPEKGPAQITVESRSVIAKDKTGLYLKEMWLTAVPPESSGL